MTEFTIHCDGKSKDKRGSWAYVVLREGEEDNRPYSQGSSTVKNVSHNEMEWEAVCQALEYCRKQGWSGDKVTILTDSELVVKQLNLEYKVGKKLSKYWVRANKTMELTGDIKVEHVPRTTVRQADVLADINWAIEFGE